VILPDPELYREVDMAACAEDLARLHTLPGVRQIINLPIAKHQAGGVTLG